MECKFCNQPLAEGETLCPHCGKDNAEEILKCVEETPVQETQPTPIQPGITLSDRKSVV